MNDVRAALGISALIVMVAGAFYIVSAPQIVVNSTATTPPAAQGVSSYPSTSFSTVPPSSTGSSGNTTPAVHDPYTLNPGKTSGSGSTATSTGSSSSSTSSGGTSSGTSSGGYTMAQVRAHASGSSCWTAIGGNVYDLTSWIYQHPGGSRAILSMCGVDGTAAFNAQHGGQGRPERELAMFLLGPLSQ